MPKTCDFLTSTFSRSCIDFGRSWASKLEPNWPSWAPRTLSKASKNRIFWVHVSQMLPKRLQSGSNKGPKEGPEVGFGRIFQLSCIPLVPVWTSDCHATLSMLACGHIMFFLLLSPTWFCIYLRCSFKPFGAAVCAQHIEFTFLENPVSEKTNFPTSKT